MDYVTFTLIVDDIVWPDGHTAMTCLGGGGPQTAFGVRMWTDKNRTVGFAAGVGADLPQSCKDWFEAMHIDTQGLMQWEGQQTLRAWQVLEADGRRTQVWRTPVGEEVWGMLRPKVHTLPKAYQKARAYHVGVHPSGLDVDFVCGLRDSGALVSIEPYTHALDFVPREELEALLTSAHIFSPNEKEAFSLVGPGEPLDVIERLVEAGAQVVCLRRGEQGCVVHRADSGETWHVPAVDMASTTADECLESVYSGDVECESGKAKQELAGKSTTADECLEGVDNGGSQIEREVSSTSLSCESDRSEPEIRGKQSQRNNSRSKLEASRNDKYRVDGQDSNVSASVRAAWTSALADETTNKRELDSFASVEGKQNASVSGFTQQSDQAEAGTTPKVRPRPGRVKDPTGCGNAFCGGFLVGWLEHRDLLTGALYGTVAASFMLEHEGVPPPSPWRHHEALKRVEDLRGRARRLSLPV